MNTYINEIENVRFSERDCEQKIESVKNFFAELVKNLNENNKTYSW